MNSAYLTDQMLDRLVDGELAGDDYREVLARLELEPDGWRRCALAFLEAQAWNRDFAPAAKKAIDVPAATSSSAAASAAKPVGGDTHWLGLLLAMAASFLLAFGLGWGIGGGKENPSSPALGTMVDKPSAPPQKPAPQEPVPANPAELETTPVSTTNQGEITLLVDDGSGEQKQVQLPVVEVNSADDVARSLGASALPAQLREALERSGHRVVRQQQIIPVELNDGRRLVMPVEEVRVMPIGGTYQ